MSRLIAANKSNSYDAATLKTPNFKEIFPSSSESTRDATSQNPPILMDEFGQTPDHYYLAKTPPSFFQVKRKLDLHPPTTHVPVDGDIDATTNMLNRNKPKRKISVPERILKGKGVDKPRYDTSLGQLTKKFLKLLSDATDGIINLNAACTRLAVPKRRLYDITNVLEGIGLIQKKSRNNIQYMGRVSSCSNVLRYENEIDVLEAKENKLDEMIYHVKSLSQMNSLSDEEAKYNYVTCEDLKRVGGEREKKNMLICVKTSPSVEVESNDKTLLIKSKTTEIDAFLLCGEVAFTNILPPHRKKAAFQECFQVQIGNNSMFGKYSGDMRKTDSVCAKEALSLNHIERGRDTLKEERASKSSEDIYNPMCSTPVWSLGDTVIKNAFISEEDDIAPIGKKHFLLETEDQDLDFIPSVFSYLETSENYSFSLDDGEGLTDLFDCNFSCP